MLRPMANPTNAIDRAGHRQPVVQPRRRGITTEHDRADIVRPSRGSGRRPACAASTVSRPSPSIARARPRRPVVGDHLHDQLGPQVSVVPPWLRRRPGRACPRSPVPAAHTATARPGCRAPSLTAAQPPIAACVRRRRSPDCRGPEPSRSPGRIAATCSSQARPTPARTSPGRCVPPGTARTTPPSRRARLDPTGWPYRSSTSTPVGPALGRATCRPSRSAAWPLHRRELAGSGWSSLTLNKVLPNEAR